MPDFFKGVAHYKKNNVFHVEVIAESDKEENTKIIVPLKYSKKCIHGDTVIVKKSSSNGIFGYVQRVVERTQTIITGKLDKKGKFGFVKPLNENYPVTFFVDLINYEQNHAYLLDGDIVEISVLDWKDSDKNPVAKVVSKLISINPDQELLYSQNLPVKFPSAVLDYCNSLTSLYQNTGTDLSHLQSFSIKNYRSGYCSTSFSVEHVSTGYNFYLHTSDLTFFVGPGSVIDIEAYRRGNSYELQKSSSPMLPDRVLDIASLCTSSRKYRQSISCVIKLNHKFNIEDVKFIKAFIKPSHVISVYEANKIINDNSYEDGYATLSLMSSFVKKISASMLKKDIIIHMPSEYPEVVWDYTEKNPVSKRVNEKCFLNTIRYAELIVNKFATSFIESNLTSEEKQNVLCFSLPHIDNQLLDKVKLKLKEAGFEWLPEYDYTQNVVDAITSKSKVISSIILNYLSKPKLKLNEFGATDAYTSYAQHTMPFDRYSDLHTQRILSAAISKKNIYSGNLTDVCDHLNRCLKKKRVVTNVVDIKAVSALLPVSDNPLNGTIINTTQKGVYVKIASNITGFVPSDEILYKIGESVLVAIKEYTKDKILMKFI